MDKIFIILPVHNRINITRKFLNYLKNQTYKNFQLILIDDGSKDETSEMVLQNLPDTIIIRGKGSWWWGGSLHQGYLWLKKQKNVNQNDLVLIINDDVEFEIDFLEKANFLINKNKDALLLAQSKSIHTKNIMETGTHIDWTNFTFSNTNKNENIDCLSTRGLFLTVSNFFKIGGFHPILLPHYLSDYEYTIRAKRKGFKLMTDESVWLWMDELTTGFHEKTDGIKKILSKKSSINPIYLLSFILLAYPGKYKLKAIYNGIILKIFAVLSKKNNN